MPTTLKFMTFAEWRNENPDLVDLEEECIECDGEGSHQCECGDEHDCGFCDGTGKVTGTSTETMYRDQLKKDKERLEKWLTRV